MEQLTDDREKPPYRKHMMPFHGAAQKLLKSVKLGNTKESFMMDRLAPRIQLGMQVYKELHKDIFGE